MDARSPTPASPRCRAAQLWQAARTGGLHPQRIVPSHTGRVAPTDSPPSKFGPMPNRGLIGAAAFAVLTLITPEISLTQQPRLALTPARPSTGSLVRITLDRVVKAGDTIVSVNGTMGGEPLHFRPAGN